MLGDIDTSMSLPEYELKLCKPNREVVAYLAEAYNIIYNPSFSDTSRLSFKIPYYIHENARQIVNPNYELIKGRYLILVNDEEYFLIEDISGSGGDIDYKECQCVSQDYQLAGKKVRDFSGTKTIYDIAEPEDSILTYIISRCPSWSMGSVDGDLSGVYRTFDISEKDMLDFISEVQVAFNCLFQFDTLNKEIDVVKVSNIPDTNNGLYISETNYLKTIKKEIKMGDVITRLHCYGNEDLSINSVIPTGQNYIDDFSYFRNDDYMSESLQDALDAYDDLLSEKDGELADLLEDLFGYQSTLATKEGELASLETELATYKQNMDACIQEEAEGGDGIIEDHDYDYWKSEYDDKQDEIDIKEGEITDTEALIDGVESDITNLGTALEMNTNFTTAQLEELDEFIYEDTWQDNNYTDADELYADGVIMLARINQPPVVFDIDSVDFLNIVDCQHDWDKLILGELINIEYSKLDIDIEVRLVGYKHDVDNNSLVLEFSNRSSIDDPYFYMDMLKRSVSASTTLNIERFKYGKYYDSERNELQSFINSELDLSKNAAIGGRNQGHRFDDTGALFTSNTNANEQLRILNNLIVMTSDGWDSVDLAISPKGIIIEQIQYKKLKL
jgi:hypothetical protein